MALLHKNRVYIDCSFPVPWLDNDSLVTANSKKFDLWLSEIVNEYGTEKRYVFYNTWEPLVSLIPMDSLRNLNCTIIDDETVTWSTPKNVEHRPYGRQFLMLTILLAPLLAPENCSVVPQNNTRHFSFINAKRRIARDVLWDKMKRDKILNENCSYIANGVYLKGEEEIRNFSEKAISQLVGMPPCYPNVLIDVAVETEEQWKLRITEKLWKPVFYKKIPLVYSAAGYYGKLKEMGFIFDSAVDWSFDNEKDDQKRLDAMYKELINLINTPLSLLERKTRNMREHNHRRVLELAIETEKPEIFCLGEDIDHRLHHDGEMFDMAKEKAKTILKGIRK